MRSRIRCRPIASPPSTNFARTSPYWDKKDDPALQLRHDLMRAKISGFMERPDTVQRRYPMSNDSLPARYARAIAGYKHGDLRSRHRPDRRLLQVAAQQSLLSRGARPGAAGGRAAERGDRAAATRASQLSNNSPLIAMMLGQALVATGNTAYTDEAIGILRAATARETEAPIGYTQLAMAYGRKGDYAEADLASAQAAFLRGDKRRRAISRRARKRASRSARRAGSRPTTL